MLLLLYPFQLALAMADRCCMTTPQGVTHHTVAAQPVADLGADSGADSGGDHGGASDPHCAACVFVHTISFLPATAMFPAVHDTVPAFAATCHTLTSHPSGRPERPQWTPAAI